jgi:hypothetical protein
MGSGLMYNIIPVLSKIQRNKFAVLLFRVLVAIWIFSARYIWISFPYHLNSDVVEGMIFPKIVSEQGLFFNDFISTTDNPLARYLLIPPILAHALGCDWITSTKISIIFLSFVTLLLLSWLLKKLGFRFVPIFAADIFMICNNTYTGYSPVYDTNINYGHTIIAMLLVLILMLDLRKNANHVRMKYKMMGLMVLSFVSGFLSIKIIAAVFVPMVIAEVMLSASKIKGEPQLYPVIQLKNLWCYMGALAVSVAGYIISEIYNRTANAYSSFPKTVATFEEIAEVFPKILNDVVILLTFPNFNIVLAKSNILLLAEVLLRIGVYILLGIGLIFVLNLKTNTSGREAILKFTAVFLLISALFVPLLVLAMYTYGRGPWHQYFTWYLVIFLVALVVDKELIRTAAYRLVCGISVFLLCAVSLYNHVYIPMQQYANADLPQSASVAQYLLANNYTSVIARNYWNANIMSGYTDLKLRAVSVNDELHPWIWSVDSRIFNESDGKFALLFTDEEITEFNEKASYVAKDLFAQGRFDTKIGDLNIYTMGFNPVKSFSMPKTNGESVSYEFYRHYSMKSDHAKVNVNEKYIESSLQGLITFGPYTFAKKGKYNLTVRYEYVEYNGDATIQIYSRLGQETHIQSTELPQMQTELRLSLQLLEDVKDLEFAFVNTADSHIRLYSVGVMKVE